MEAVWMADRARLRSLAQEHPTWTQRDLAQATGRSLSWVKKWLKRLAGSSKDDLEVLRSRSRAHHAPYPQMHPRLVQRIVEMREQPPGHLQRTPGPRALLYYLPRDPEVQALGVPLPRSTRTIWKILREQGCILDATKSHPRPTERRDPLEEVQLDFKDPGTVPPDPEGKQQHVVEICNFVDAGTSIWLWQEARSDFNAETALEAVVTFLKRYGRPRLMTFDRDPRWVGSQSRRDFPSAFRRFLLCVGIEPNVCPPRRPDKNAFVERLHRTLNQECLQIHRPTSLEQVREVTATFQIHYNHERPHQGRACQNRPPRVAFPTLPHLSPLPQQVDPDRWLWRLDGRAFARKVGSDGCVEVDTAVYYIKQALAGTWVVLFVKAAERVFEVWQEGTLLKTLPIKGLLGRSLPLEQYVEVMKEQARSEERQQQEKQHRLRQLSLWG